MRYARKTSMPNILWDIGDLFYDSMYDKLICSFYTRFVERMDPTFEGNLWYQFGYHDVWLSYLYSVTREFAC